MSFYIFKIYHGEIEFFVGDYYFSCSCLFLSLFLSAVRRKTLSTATRVPGSIQGPGERGVLQATEIK